LVLLLDKKNERGMWPFGRVIEVFPSDDGRVRKVSIRTSEQTYMRPVTRLATLEYDTKMNE